MFRYKSVLIWELLCSEMNKVTEKHHRDNSPIHNEAIISEQARSVARASFVLVRSRSMRVLSVPNNGNLIEKNTFSQ